MNESHEAKHLAVFNQSHIESQPTGSQLVSREVWQDTIAQHQHSGENAAANIIEPLSVMNVKEEKVAYNALTSIIVASANSETEIYNTLSHVARIEKAARGGGATLLEDPYGGLERGRIDHLIDTRLQVLADPVVQELAEGRNLGDAHNLFLERWPVFKVDFATGVYKGIETGYLPSSLLSRLKGALTQTKVRLADPAVLGAYGGMSAYYNNENDEVAVGHSSELSFTDVKMLLGHELTHKLSGGTFTPLRESPSKTERPRLGFSTEKKDALTRTGLNEAMTEHITQGILTGDFETLDPDKRKNDGAVYYEYRKILAAFVDRAHGVIDVKSIIHGYFEDTGPEGGIEARRKMIGEVNKAYGWGALKKLDKLMELVNLGVSDRLEEVILSRIHPPTLDARGNVIKVGYIDLENFPTFYELYKNPK